MGVILGIAAFWTWWKAVECAKCKKKGQVSLHRYYSIGKPNRGTSSLVKGSKNTGLYLRNVLHDKAGGVYPYTSGPVCTNP
jgi:hypothetical protein